MKGYQHIVIILSTLVLKLPRFNFDVVDYDHDSEQKIEEKYENGESKIRMSIIKRICEYRKTKNTDALDGILEEFQALDDIRFKHLGNLTQELRYRFIAMDSWLENLHTQIECSDDEILQNYTSIIEDWINNRNFTSFSALLTQFEEELQRNPNVTRFLKPPQVVNHSNDTVNGDCFQRFENFNVTQEMETKLENVNRQIENIYRIMVGRKHYYGIDKSEIREWLMKDDRRINL